MFILARLIGVVITAVGTSIALNPAIFRAVMNFWIQDKRIYLAGTLRLIFGTIFLLAAPGARLPAVLSVLGVLMIIGGILIFVIGQKRIQAIFNWWEKKPPFAMRLMGLVVLSIGAAILYST